MSGYRIVKESEGHPVECPFCQKRFGIRQKKGGGTYYAKNMTNLTKTAQLIVRWWLDNWEGKWLTRAEAYRMFHQYAVDNKENMIKSEYGRTVAYKMVSFVARMSEMVGLGIFESTSDYRQLVDEESQSFRNMEPIPRYRINQEKALRILIDKGRITERYEGG